MSWLYPERWPGWMDHARVGGGVFDDGPGLVRVLSACWQHYSSASGIASRVSLSPPPRLRILFRDEVLRHPQWSPALAYAREAFRPEISGVALPFDLTSSRDIEEATSPQGRELLAEPRHFTFVLDSPQHQHMTCFFYLDQRVVGAMDLGQINLLGDRRQLAIQRRLGITRGSDIQTCYQSSPLWDELPEAMQRDLRYLGWTFSFATAPTSSGHGGGPRITIDTLPAVGFLEGGELLIDEGAALASGVAFDFYQGLRHGRPDPGLRCRLLLVPKGVQPARPRLSAAECFLHRARAAEPQSPHQDDLLDVRIWVASAPMVGAVQLHLTTEADQQQTIALEGGQPSSDGRLLFQAMVPSRQLSAGTTLQLRLTGKNQFGLAFAAHERLEVPLRAAIDLRLPRQSVLSTSQLRREWELIARCEWDDDSPAPTFDLAAVTLWLQSGAAPPVQLPLASTTPGKLLFRYLPKSIDQQLPIEKLASGDTLRAWISQTRGDQPLAPGQGWLSQQDNRPDAPLFQYRLLDFNSDCRLLPPDASLLLGPHDELALEGARLQALPGLSLPQEDEPHPPTTDERVADLLLLEVKGGLREITLTHQGAEWLSTAHQVGARKATAPTSRRLRSLWLSCSHDDHWVEAPGQRTPEGGPCLAFGLGIGNTQEMAQIKPSPEGFRLYRHRQHVAVYADDQVLPTEPHSGATGMALDAPKGWLLIGDALLRYQQQRSEGRLQLHLIHFGYLHVRRHHQRQLRITCGPEAATAHEGELAGAFHVHVPGGKRAGSLALTIPEPPAPGKPQRLWQQLQGQTQLPAPLEYGKNYEHGSLCWSVWALAAPQKGSSETPALGTPLKELSHASAPSLQPPEDAPQRLFLELRRPYGRKRFALTTKHDRLGFWREGSAFLSVGGQARPVMASELGRQLSGDKRLPPGALLVGTDVTQADLVLPQHLHLPELPFALLRSEGRLRLWPLHPETCPIQLHRFPDGSMSIHDHRGDNDAPSEGWDITPVPGGKQFFRSQDVVFSVSAHPDDLAEQPQADLLFSIRGVCHTVEGPFPIGGPHHKTPLPLLDPIPPFAPDIPLVTIYPPTLHLKMSGDALLGLQQPAPSHSLLDQLKRSLREGPRPEPQADDETTPLHYLAALLQPRKAASDKDQEPLTITPSEWLHQSQELPDHFLTEGDTLKVGELSLAYHFRQRHDGHPAVDRAPAWLALSPPQEVHLALTDDGLALPTGEAIDALSIGRADPEQEHEQIDAGTPGELHLSAPYPAVDGAQTWAKLLLWGYAPRGAARIRREGENLWLEIPAPPADQYHLTVAGEPIRKATRLAIPQFDAPTGETESDLHDAEEEQTLQDLKGSQEQAALRLHINHLLMLRLWATEEQLHIQLEGYMIGHQRDPARPVRLARANRVGRIHLQSPGSIPQIALQTALCPPHFRDEEGLVSLGPWPTSTLSDTPDQDQAPAATNKRASLALVDLQAWKPSGPLVSRPPSCDRLLWFLAVDPSPADEEGLPHGMIFPSEDAPQEASTTPPGLWDDEGSSFAFGGGGHGADEGSSFAFGNSLAGPRSQDTQETETQEELEAAFPTLRLGWRKPQSQDDREASAQRHYGLISDLGGPHVMLYQPTPGLWQMTPGDHVFGPYPELSRTSEERQVTMAIWQRGRWQPLSAAVSLEPQTELLLRCGPAGFKLMTSADGSHVAIQRMWLWLPARQRVSLTTGEPQVPSPQGQREIRIGLGDESPPRRCTIWPLRRGHSLEQQPNGATSQGDKNASGDAPDEPEALAFVVKSG